MLPILNLYNIGLLNVNFEPILSTFYSLFNIDVPGNVSEISKKSAAVLAISLNVSRVPKLTRSAFSEGHNSMGTNSRL
jgi:hypothetical protein